MSKRLENSFDIDGEVVFVGQPVSITPTFTKRVLVIKTQKGSYDTDLAFEFINKQGNMLDDIESGDVVLVNFQVGGRQKKDKMEWYQQIEGRSVQKL